MSKSLSRLTLGHVYWTVRTWTESLGYGHPNGGHGYITCTRNEREGNIGKVFFFFLKI